MQFEFVLLGIRNNLVRLFFLSMSTPAASASVVKKREEEALTREQATCEFTVWDQHHGRLFKTQAAETMELHKSTHLTR